MSLAIVYTRASYGMDAPLVTVEVHLGKGIPRTNIVGLPAVAVKESKDRVRSALLNAGFDYPRRRVTINLAPADLPKEGGRFDLPIAIGILSASGQIPNTALSQSEWVGELALSGEIRPVRGVLPMVLAARETNRVLIVPQQNAAEAGLVQPINVLQAAHLLQVCAHLRGTQKLAWCESTPLCSAKNPLDLKEVCGQFHAKRALEIAAAGQHSLLLKGPPGTGKTMLASRLTSILPDLTDQEAYETAAVASISHTGFNAAEWHTLPFRAPHHSSSAAALVGGGRPPRPGEISLAHHGVLFLDELTEFSRPVLESLREPLESGHVTISRAAYQARFPARFQLIAAMNPCPCGYLGSAKKECRCTLPQVERYLAKLSGPLLDRIDMQIEVGCLPAHALSRAVEQGEESQIIKARVVATRQTQLTRQGKSNQDLTVGELQHHCALTAELLQWLDQMMERYHFSARSYHRIIKVARTIADMEQCENISGVHLQEAMTYRLN